MKNKKHFFPFILIVGLCTAIPVTMWGQDIFTAVEKGNLNQVKQSYLQKQR
ncbi:MAG: hypothetical protein JXB26_00280 [Candidatus Aminicenantes bacterium]|nr:hypothetical protein [Candidatus Aminicenantes bacterium]